MTTGKLIEEVLNDPTMSDWLKWALRSALNRDPLDVTNDAEILFMILAQRLNELFAENAPFTNLQNECVPL